MSSSGVNEHEIWRQHRRDEWSEYMGMYATSDLQYKFKQMTGLDDDILDKYEENIPLQLWVDNIVDKLDSKYHEIREAAVSPEKNTWTTILHLIGFNNKVLECHKYLDDENDISSHFGVEETFEIIIRNVLYDIFDSS